MRASSSLENVKKLTTPGTVIRSTLGRRRVGGGAPGAGVLIIAGFSLPRSIAACEVGGHPYLQGDNRTNRL